jgi:hypothetical protein
MKARAAAVAEVIRPALDAADRLDPAERGPLYAALVADLRARRPENVAPLGLGTPSDPAAIRDRRERAP